MKIIVKEQEINVLSVSVDEEKITIQTDIKQTTPNMVLLLNDSPAITYCDDNGDIVNGINSGSYTLHSIEERGNARKYYLHIPTTLAEVPKSEIERMNEQITNIELALCEIYENMGV